jgi:hypothetical protein
MEVGVATEMLLTKAEKVSDDGACGRVTPKRVTLTVAASLRRFGRGGYVSCAWRYAGSQLAAGGLNS